MSACSCYYGDGPIGACVMRNRTARTDLGDRAECPNCGYKVEVGQRCIDYAGIDEDGRGFFNRFHEACFLLMENFAEKVCHGSWRYPFDADEAAEHAFANADEPYWREWLELYETTWSWTQEPADPWSRPATGTAMATTSTVSASGSR